MTKSEVRKILLKKAFAEARHGNFNFYKDTMDRYYGKPVDKVDLNIEKMETLEEQIRDLTDEDREIEEISKDSI